MREGACIVHVVHGHEHGQSRDRRRLGIALAVTLGSLVVGLAGAFLTGSLALLADAGHLLTDVTALLAAFIAAVLAQRAPSKQRTFGLGRAEVLVAGLNALALIAVVVWIAYQNVQRLLEPVEIPGLPFLVFAAAGLVGNVISLVVLAGGDRRNLNLRGAMLHVMGDALGSVGALVAATVLLLTGWTSADSVASLAIAALILPRAVQLLRDAGHVLLEGTPSGVDVDDVRRELLAVPGVVDVHDLHVWAINERNPAVSAHLVIDGPTDVSCGDTSVLDTAGNVLRERFALAHSTLQVEHDDHAEHEDPCS